MLQSEFEATLEHTRPTKKRRGSYTHSKAWMDFGILLSEISQTRKDKHSVLAPV